jgi:hypothetical protein
LRPLQKTKHPTTLSNPSAYLSVLRFYLSLLLLAY